MIANAKPIRMTRRFLLGIACGLVLSSTQTPALGDTVELSGGGHLAGKVLRRESSGKIPFVVVEVDEDITLALPEKRVRRVVKGEQLAEYRKRAAAAGDDAQKHYELARWCAASKLPLGGQKRYHHQRAIELNPEHALSRAALGYVRDGNKWILYTDQQRNRGMISVGGKWKLPEAVAMENFQDATNSKAKRWIKDIARLRSVAINKGSAKSGEAFQQLAAIEDPLAATAIAKELSANRPREYRELCVKLLGKFRNATSVHALTLAGLDDKDERVREAAISELEKFGSASAVNYYVQKLRSNDKRSVRDALRALEQFPNSELAQTYINALVTEHKTVGPASPGINAGFGTSSSGNGGGSFSTGSKQEVKTERMKNPAALSLLKTIEPGVDYGYDKQAWREHFASKLTTYRGDLRRDP